MQMAKSNSKGMLPNGRRAYKSEQYFKALYAIFDNPDYIALPHSARALLWDLSRQYNGKNNGDLSLAPNVMKKWGWGKSTILRQKKCLIKHGWIFITGHKTARNGYVLFYGLTWLDINECDGKLYPDSYSHKPRSLKK